MRSLRQCLLDADAVVLRVIAERWSLNPIGLKPRELVDRLEEAISTPARATLLLDDLPGAEREALRALLTAGARCPWRTSPALWLHPISGSGSPRTRAIVAHSHQPR